VASGEAWSRLEVEAVVADYFAMLEKELRREPFNKSTHRRKLQGLLNGRSEGSIERKHQNITAILIKARFPSIAGYKPLFNYQALLADVVLERIEDDAILLDLARAYVEATVSTTARDDVLSRMVRPPEMLEQVRAALSDHQRRRYARHIDDLALEASNRRLGAAGEDFVVAYEHAHLSALGMSSLAREVERVSLTRGDGLGFDVASFFPDGRERFIEVKTTQLGASTPFYVTRNEVKFSEENDEKYSLYRVFTFASDPKLFSLDGQLTSTCALTANQYLAIPH
jgi:Domain of unknown function (DUF3883)